MNEMNNNINDGGPAFPRTGADGHTSPQSGMTLRDYFAAAALQGMNLDFNFSCTTYAMDAYLIADAMIRAREVKP